MNGEGTDREALSGPGFRQREEGLDEPPVLDPQDFLVAQEDGSADHHYRVGRWALPGSGVLTAVVAVAEVENVSCLNVR